MIVSRALAALGALGVVTAVLVLPVAPAGAHGATANPPSRAVVCAPDAGRAANSTACRAAVSAGGGRGFGEWDNVRVAGVAGRDRERIPDGRLCSGGIDAFRGLDLARADWPATAVSPGARFTFRYRQRVPHEGTFRLYVTRRGYDPTRPLRWADVGARPFLTVTDPPLRGDAYVFPGRLPTDRAGRHVILVIWQNSGTPDTYYSCSDVRFVAPRAGPAPGGTAAAPSPRKPPAAATRATPASPVAQARATEGFSEAPGTPRPVALALAGGAGSAAVIAVVGVLVARRRRRW
jgi:chitin-binding protein